jgi:hypothetical protein
MKKVFRFVCFLSYQLRPLEGYEDVSPIAVVLSLEFSVASLTMVSNPIDSEEE